MKQNPNRHPLFRRFPIDGQVRLSTGTAPTPYHVYDGHGLFIGGTADLAAVHALLAPEQVRPVRTADGRALMGVWVFDFEDASLGPHHELQFSLFVSPTEQAPVEPHALNLIELMLTRPDIHMLCHGLWNSTPLAAAYNRELLGLDARISRSQIEDGGEYIDFAVDDLGTQDTVLQGRIHRPRRPSLHANLALVARVGLVKLWRVASQPWLKTQILNPVGHGLARNALADSFTKAERSALRYFVPGLDRLEFGDNRYQRLQFRPQFTQFMEGFRFVYLQPR